MDKKFTNYGFLASLFVLFALFSMPVTSLAQYPDVPSDVRKEAEQAKQAAWESVNAKWEAAHELRDSLEANGKPFIPWASDPNDLPQAKIPAFPGAEGGGAHSFGGRGGDVYVVTSLEDSGPGTFREALESVGPRIVVFNVSGIIRLEKPLIIKAPYITIAGQTAPGDGVVVAGETVWINTHDVVIRHMRFRRGETNVGRRDDSIGGNPIGNIMIDHVSASWGLDENMSMYRHNYMAGADYDEVKLPTVNITIQNSIFSEGLDTYNHAFGSTLGGENCTFVRNLWASNTGRNPSVGWNGLFNFVNNVVFNWRHRSTDGGDYRATFNIINNYYKPGPITPPDEPVGHRILKPEAGRSDLDFMVFGRAYVSGNVMEGYPGVTADNWDGGVQIEGKDGELLTYWESTAYFPNMKMKSPFPMQSPIDIMPARKAYEYVLKNAGATLPKRDPVDHRIVRQVRTGKIEYVEGLDPDQFYQFEHRRLGPESYKKGIITNIKQVGGYPEYEGMRYKDEDMDGMPNAWENKHGLNPKDPSDANGDMNEDGYTNIEMYINGINPETEIDWTKPSNNYDTLAGEETKGGLLKR
ncbi:hypothetical protein NC796_12280 [Aliifodinibius sp. S!AR15-10]|uniref:pectate lyase family protein n=1 Tax=Aliifodinibius sp. S!AR15-10 TaxID=2950437 RepID=UPI0028616547|nr:hypothetical protein [Aliifodinibius sp. S!AR15-10]MDR8391926.1 hypothetical protein [Aliifodinibius sp. S!AR15-10]